MAKHRWRFFRAGGLDQQVIREERDITNLRQLDQKLWVTLACPTKGLDEEQRDPGQAGARVQAADWSP